MVIKFLREQQDNPAAQVLRQKFEKKRSDSSFEPLDFRDVAPEIRQDILRRYFLPAFEANGGVIPYLSPEMNEALGLQLEQGLMQEEQLLQQRLADLQELFAKPQQILSQPKPMTPPHSFRWLKSC